MQEVVDILTQWLRAGTMSAVQLQELGFNVEDIVQASQNVAALSPPQLTTVNQAQIPSLPLNQVELLESLSSSWEVVKDPPSALPSDREHEIPSLNENESSTSSSNVSFSVSSWEFIEGLSSPVSQEDILSFKSVSSVSNESSNDNLTPSPSWEVVEALPLFPLQVAEEEPSQFLIFSQKLYDKQDSDSMQNKLSEVAEKPVPRNSAMI